MVQVLRSMKVDLNSLSGSLVLSEEADLLVTKIYIFVRNQFKEDFMSTIISAGRIPGGKDTIGYRYDILPTARDGETREELEEELEYYIENKIGPIFEEKFNAFVEDEQRYEKYRDYLRDNDRASAEEIVDEFLLSTASDEEKLRLDRKAKKAKKAAEKAAKERQKHEKMLKSLGVSTKALAAMMMLI